MLLRRVSGGGMDGMANLRLLTPIIFPKASHSLATMSHPVVFSFIRSVVGCRGERG